MHKTLWSWAKYEQASRALQLIAIRAGLAVAGTGRFRVERVGEGLGPVGAVFFYWGWFCSSAAKLAPGNKSTAAVYLPAAPCSFKVMIILAYIITFLHLLYCLQPMY